MRDSARRGPGTPHARRVARAAAGVAAVAALALAAACGGDSTQDVGLPPATAGAPTSLPASLPTGIPTALPSGLSLPGVGGADVPKDFPIPPGATSGVTAVGGTHALSLTGVPTDEAFAFYREALPKAGYKIVTDSTGSGSLPGAIGFTGHDVAGVISGTDVLGQSAVVVTFGAPR